MADLKEDEEAFVTTEAVAEEDEELKDEVYTHPSIRELTHDQLIMRLEQIRARRLVAAQEFRTASILRIDKEHTKLCGQWETLAAKLSRKEYAIREEIEKFEKDINKLIQIHNQASILEK